MKKVLSLVLVLALCLTLFAACGSKKSADDKTITVAASPVPHAEILKVVGEVLAKDGYTLTVTEYPDYVVPNNVVEDGEMDANYFQHQPYLDEFNAENGTHLVTAATVHYEPYGIYAGTKNAISALSDGDSIAVPNDTTNRARALLLLQDNGIIKMKDDAGMTATKLDIVENPLNLDIVEMEAAQISTVRDSVALVVLNGNYAMAAGLNVGKDAIAAEGADSLAARTYGNIIAVKDGNQNSAKVQALVKAIMSPEVRDYINGTYEGAVVPMF